MVKSRAMTASIKARIRTTPARSMWARSLGERGRRISICAAQMTIWPPSNTGSGSKFIAAKLMEINATKRHHDSQPPSAAFPAPRAKPTGPLTFFSNDNSPPSMWPRN